MSDLSTPSGGGERISEEESPAQRLFRAEREYQRAESEMIDSLLRIAGADPRDPDTWPCDDVIHDFYDESFEFRGTCDDWAVPANTIAQWAALGFDRCWICYLDGSEIAIDLRDGRQSQRQSTAYPRSSGDRRALHRENSTLRAERETLARLHVGGPGAYADMSMAEITAAQELARRIVATEGQGR